MNRFKSIVVTDRYNITYVKNFTLFADGSVGLQKYDSLNARIITVNIEKIRRRVIRSIG